MIKTSTTRTFFGYGYNVSSLIPYSKDFIMVSDNNVGVIAFNVNTYNPSTPGTFPTVKIVLGKGILTITEHKSSIYKTFTGTLELFKTNSAVYTFRTDIAYDIFVKSFIPAASADYIFVFSLAQTTGLQDFAVTGPPIVPVPLSAQCRFNFAGGCKVFTVAPSGSGAAFGSPYECTKNFSYQDFIWRVAISGQNAWGRENPHFTHFILPINEGTDDPQLVNLSEGNGFLTIFGTGNASSYSPYTFKIAIGNSNLYYKNLYYVIAINATISAAGGYPSPDGPLSQSDKDALKALSSGNQYDLWISAFKPPTDPAYLNAVKNSINDSTDALKIANDDAVKLAILIKKSKLSESAKDNLNSLSEAVHVAAVQTRTAADAAASSTTVEAAEANEALADKGLNDTKIASDAFNKQYVKDGGVPPPDAPDGAKSGLSTTTIVIIVAVSVVAVVLLIVGGVVAYIMYKKRKKLNEHAATPKVHAATSKVHVVT